MFLHFLFWGSTFFTLIIIIVIIIVVVVIIIIMSESGSSVELSVFRSFAEKVQRVYGDLNGDLHLVELDRNGASSIGLSLVGNRDTATMSVFVAGVHPSSLAGSDGRIHVGDELLEVSH